MNGRNYGSSISFRRFFRNRVLQKALLLSALAAAVLVIALSGRNVIQAEEETDPCKYYTSIMIYPGDSLWSIACTYMDGHYSGIQEYIDELKLINNLQSDTIHAYEHLLVSYYGSDTDLLS